MLRRLELKDNPAVRDIIRTVMPEFGASGKGFAIHDSEVEDMYGFYTQPRCAYFVWEENGKILGGGGVAPLAGGDAEICELKKMYFLPEGRGKGLGQTVLTECLKAAKALGFYLLLPGNIQHHDKRYEAVREKRFQKNPRPVRQHRALCV
jgi:putative acetyltransferase